MGYAVNLQEALLEIILEQQQLAALSDREVVTRVLHSKAASQPAVMELMSRLDPGWEERECPPDCWACEQEMRRD